MTGPYSFPRLADVAPVLERQLRHGADVPAAFGVSEIRCASVTVSMRDGVQLATDLYFPPTLPAAAVVMRTPYGRAVDKLVATFMAFARRGYVVVAQDCRGTGDSEPDRWDYYMYEPEDGSDCIEWVIKQRWFSGFVAGCGGSYVGQTQWCMAMHPKMSTIAPEVSGLGVAVNTVHLHMLVNAYARSVGKGEGKAALHYSEMERLMLAETLAGGYFNEPLHLPFSATLVGRFRELQSMPPSRARRWLWQHYCRLSCTQRASFVRELFGTDRVSMLQVEALSSVFGHQISHDAHSLPHADRSELCQSVRAPALMITGWYDWALNDALATWELLRREAPERVRSNSRLIITPGAHSAPGYHEGMAAHPELRRAHRTETNVGLLLRWYAAVREEASDTWPTVIYYLMGANDWRVAADWPPPAARTTFLYLCADRVLSVQPPQHACSPDQYTYDPQDPTPTIGGSIVSHVYQPGSVDVSQVQQRSDVLSYTTALLHEDFDAVGPLRLVLYASSTAVDTDFSARLSDVFPDGRAIQLQSGILRARYRDLEGEPELLEPGRIYRFEIDMWATANRFKAGHRLRLDISSADFPRFDRNSNRGGEPGPPLAALQTIYHDAEHSSHLIISVLNDPAFSV